MGNAWTADYLKITGELDVDLRSNIAAEARAKIVYERLINFCDDAGTKDALQFLMTREITHMKAFAPRSKAWASPPSASAGSRRRPGLVDQYFNDSTGTGDHGEIDTRGPWNEGDDWEFVESPAFQNRDRGQRGTVHRAPRARPPEALAGLEELLIDQLRDILACREAADEGIARRWPRRRAPTSSASCSRVHLAETEAQVERLERVLRAARQDAARQALQGDGGPGRGGRGSDEGECKRRTMRPPILP